MTTPTAAAEYLQASQFIDSEHPDIVQLAQTIAGPEVDDLEKAVAWPAARWQRVRAGALPRQLYWQPCVALREFQPAWVSLMCATTCLPSVCAAL